MEHSMSDDLPGKRRPRRQSPWREMWHYLKARKKWWLAPVLVILLALGLLAVFTESSALAPFLYTVF
jgi:hypothetical protein